MPGPGRPVARLRASTGTAPAKLILVGEHAVVHGARAVALPFPALGARARFSPMPGGLRLETADWQGPAEAAPDVFQGLVAAARDALARLGAPAAGGTIALGATVPGRRGMGSSASVALALVRALHAAAGAPLRDAEALRLIQLAESHAHGNPSGVDAAAVLATGPIAFRRGEAPRALEVGATLYGVAADSGVPRDTHSAVAAIASRTARDPVGTQARFVALDGLAAAAEAALAAGDAGALGEALDAAQAHLAALGLAEPATDRLVAAARAAGAPGAKLTGAGRGGTVIALATDAAHQAALSQALSAAGAPGAWPFTLERTP